MTEQNYEILKMDSSAPALEQMIRAEIDVAISTAKRYPMHSNREGLVRFKTESIEMATLDSDTAESCIFATPRAGKILQGPSVRLAEIVVACYGNIRAGARILEVGAREVVAQGVCHDLERNCMQNTEVRRRIVNSWGKRYNDDLIQLTCNAACSIAFRNAVYKVIPASLCQPAYQAARRMCVGDIQTLDQRRAKALKRFALMGVPSAKLVEKLGKNKIEDIGVDEMATLVGLYNALTNHEISIDDFMDKPLSEMPGERTENLANKVDGGAKNEKPQETSPGPDRPKRRRGRPPKEKPTPEPAQSGENAESESVAGEEKDVPGDFFEPELPAQDRLLIAQNDKNLTDAQVLDILKQKGIQKNSVLELTPDETETAIKILTEIESAGE